MTALEQPRRTEGDLLAEAVRHYYAGAPMEAERLCAEILVHNPQQVVALSIGSEIALARGDLASARERLRPASRSPPADLDLLLRLIRLMHRASDTAALEATIEVLRTRLRANPRGLAELYALGQACEATGRLDEAIAAYDAACKITPVHRAGVHTARSILLLRRAWGDPLPSPAAKQQVTGLRGRVTMTQLGLMGRIANQIFQYGFLRIYGHVHGLQVEVPDWIGRWLFDLDDPYPVGAPLTPAPEKRGLMGPHLSESAQPSLANRDLVGFFQCHTSHFRPQRSFFCTLFEPGARLQPIVDRVLARLRERGRTVVAIHLRRGDYTGGPLFWPAPASWYLDWLRVIWRELAEPVLYVASDDDAVQREFAEFAPVTAADIGQPASGAEMYPDFHILAHADLLAISNSSFSVAAAMLNERGRMFVRPDAHLQRLVPFEPWNTEVLLSAEAPAKPS